MTRRQALWAVLISLALPGLGQIYAGAFRRGVCFAAGLFAVQLAFTAAQAVARPSSALFWSMAGLLALAVVATLLVAANAWRTARANQAPVPPGWRGSAWTALAGMLLVEGAMELLPGASWAYYSVPSASMQPSLEVGDRFIALAGFYDRHSPRRGDVVVFTLPAPGVTYVKRVIGLGGDRVQMRGGTLWLNGTAVPRERDPAGGPDEVAELPDGRRFAVRKIMPGGAGDQTEEFTVPSGHVFVMGDSIDNSLDSRQSAAMRFVPVSALVGPAAIVFWSDRWARVGMEIQ